MKRRLFRSAVIGALILVAMPLGLTAVARLQVTAPPMSDAQVQSNPITDTQVQTIADAVARAWRRERVEPSSLPPRLLDANQGVYIGARRGGRLVSEQWSEEGDTVWDGIIHALDAIRSEVPASPPDTLQMDLVHSVRLHDYPKDRQWLLTDLFRGIRGIAVQTHTETHRLSPSRAITHNIGNEAFIDDASFFPAFMAGGVEEQRALKTYATFGSDQLLITLQPEVRGLRLQRGGIQVRPEAVNAEAITQVVDGLAGWLMKTQQASGRMTYLYLPSEEGRDPDRDNMIRRWMASSALVRWAEHTGDEAVWAAATKSIEHNLEVFYSEEDGLGLIRWNGKVKLGALAIAAYTLHIHRDGAQWREQELALRRTIEGLIDEDGSIRSWHETPDHNAPEQPNFYPGEALFYWAQIITDGDNPEFLESYMKSFEYYRQWHLQEDNRHPAFVPWHTQANYQVWQKTRDPELARFIFEMNDWLVHIQQWDDAVFEDLQGHFFKPGHSFGTGHSSATGVYIEGLIDAWRLAVELNDHVRAERYRQTMLRAARSIMQTQFMSEAEAFYVEDKQMVLGGVRTRVWDNGIRCDNVQHAMMGMLKMLQFMNEEQMRLISAERSPDP